ncbi:molybdate ABC transporter substrate-binding protein [Rhodoplanes sp. TEM]|uniref:Molybdate ABC transporter substrate-binding protein n=2 Tax=Nitrobacteraceae TaxID=41294 RepID=A0ABT5JGP2_RHOTP|nr:molybdate ABC transporter substrate-binding protein [Rhodoplanes tepidamans]MDC7788880.1 molybdate ABC transporter substrate-binding protein [Rhodoplanes tepidamans]MDC7987511.1 molybdate ABC transporter substrate-binding protein [Rhodoplanes sp. TEM]
MVVHALVAAVVAWSTAMPARAQESAPVTVFAAASLTNVLNDIGKAFTAETKIPVRFSYAASSTLARQMEQGAPADLFASADLAWMDWSQERKLIDPKTRVSLLGNRLVVVAPADGKIAKVDLTRDGLKAALGDGRLATGAVASVPVGKYAKTALETLGLWGEVEPKLAQAESVRAALVLVARGEASLGIVYETDAKAEPRVKVVAVFPADSHPAVVYPFALTAVAKGDAPARFLAFLSQPAARAVFEAGGFTVLKPAGH